MAVRSLLAAALIAAAPACAQEPTPTPAPDLEAAAEGRPSWDRPPATAEPFAPELWSPDGWTFTPTVTPDLRTLYYVRWDAPDYDDPASIQELFESRWDEAAGRWAEPQPVEALSGWRVDWPHVTPDGRRLLVSTNKPHAGHYAYPDGRPSDDFDLWAADRLDAGPEGGPRWGPFRPMEGDDLNRQKTPRNARVRYVHNETSPRADLEGRLYFWTERLDDGGGRRDVYEAVPDAEGALSNPRLLPFNTAARESGVAVDPLGRWLVVASEGLDGPGRSDLYLVPREGDGWGDPIGLGPAVNTEAAEDSPEISADGRVLFFSSDRPVPGVAEVDAGEGSGPPPLPYWVDLLALPAVEALLAD